MTNNSDSAANDVHLQRIRRNLVRLMLGSLIITFVLVGLVLAAVIYKIMRPTEQLSGQAANMDQPIEQQLDLDARDVIVSYTVSGDIITLWNRSTMQDNGTLTNNEFIFYDYRRGQVLSRLKINSDISPATK